MDAFCAFEKESEPLREGARIDEHHGGGCCCMRAVAEIKIQRGLRTLTQGDQDTESPSLVSIPIITMI